MNRSQREDPSSTNVNLNTVPSEAQEVHAFVIVILPHVGGRPHYPGDEYSVKDHFYACIEGAICDCPLYPSSGFWKASSITPGGAFDGRIRGIDPKKRRFRGPDAERAEWEVNHVVRAGDVPRPISAYAIITPNGMWHECVEPEPQDLIIGDVKPGYLAALSRPFTALTRLQVEWRSEVEYILDRYRYHSVLGCEAVIATDTPRKCYLDETFFRRSRD